MCRRLDSWQNLERKHLERDAVVCALAWSIRRVESAFGSQPTIMTFFPSAARPATVFCVVVDFPMPPFP